MSERVEVRELGSLSSIQGHSIMGLTATFSWWGKSSPNWFQVIVCMSPQWSKVEMGCPVGLCMALNILGGALWPLSTSSLSAALSPDSPRPRHSRPLLYTARN